MSEERGFLPVLRNRAFLYLWIAQVFAQTAENGIHYVQMVLIEELTHSSAHMGGVILSFSLPAVLLSVVAGVVVDRLPNKWVMVVSNALRVFIVSVYVFALYTLKGSSLLLAIYTITFIVSAIGQFFAPAEVATIPLLVGRRRLLTANSLFNLTFTASQVVGLVIMAPIAVKLVGISGAFVVVTFMYLVAALLVALLPRDEPHLQSNSEFSAIKRAWLEIREGWIFVVSHHSIYVAMVQLILIAILVLVMAMLAPGFAGRVLGMNTEDAIYVFAPAGVGMLASTFLVGRFGHRFRREHLTNGGLIAMGLTLVALSAVGRLGGPMTRPTFQAYPELTISVAGMVMILALLLGFEMALISIPAQTILQERSSVDIRGRVFAVRFLLTNLMAIPPMLFIGNLADRIGIPRVVLLIALGVLTVGVVSLYYGHRHRPHGNKEHGIQF